MNSDTIDPPLPRIHDIDLLLEVHTHRDLRPPAAFNDTRWGDTERLADLGAKVLDTVVTYHFFSKVPCIPAHEIAVMRERFTAPTMLDSWLNYYHLKQKYRVPPDQSDAIYSDLREMATYFHTYLGAVYLGAGLETIQNWISKLIDPTGTPPTTKQQQPVQDGLGVGNTGYQNSYSSPPPSQHSYTAFASTSHFVPTPPAGPPPPLPSTPMPLPGTMNLISLSLVNQTAMQKGFTINYAASQEGPPHQPTWTVRCLINNIERGIGIGKSQKLAKEEAARRAWLTMGW